MNVSHLKSQSCLNCIRRIWHLMPRLRGWLDCVLAECHCPNHFFLEGYRRQIIAIRWKRNKAIKDELEMVSQCFQSNPFNEELQARAARLKYHLKVTRIQSAKEAWLQARLHWLRTGNRPSKDFFKALATIEVMEKISSIKTSGGLLSKKILKKSLFHTTEWFFNLKA
jgi:hypothetical protein